MMDNDDVVSQSLIANNDNVTWYQELVESWKSYDLLEKIIITMRLSLIIIVFIILIWFLSKFSNLLDRL